RLRRQLRESVHRAAGVRPRLLEWAARPAVAWSVAAIAVMWAVAATVERGAPSGVTDDGARMAGIAASSDLADTAAAAVASSAGIRAESMPRVDVDAEPANESMPVAAAAAVGDHSVSVERWNPIGLLPGEIVVDAQSVAVLPFYGVLGMVEQNPAIQGVGGSPAADRIAM